MADVNTEAKATITAEDRTGDTFAQVGRKMKEAEQSAGSLSKGFADLGTVVKTYLGYQALRQAVTYFTSISAAAMDDLNASRLLSAQMASLGVDTEGATAAIDEHVQKMIKLGQTGGETTQGLMQLVRATKDVQSSIELSKLAADVAISQNISYAEAVDLLQNVLVGKGVRSLKAYGQALDENATVAQQLVAVQNLVTRTMESAAEDNDRQVARMQTSWAEFQQQLGLLGVWMANDFARFFNGALESMGSSAGDWARKIAKAFEVAKYVVLEDSPIRKIVDAFTGGGTGRSLKDAMADFDANWKKMVSSANAGTTKVGTDISRTVDLFGNLGGSADKEADRVKQAFSDLSKSIVKSIDDQADAVRGLKDDIRDLDSQLDDSIAKSEENYQKKVADIARAAQSRVEDIDKQIAQEEATRGQGFRTRIEQLQQEKAKEQDIIRRAGLQVSDLKAQLAQDDLQQAAAAHTAEIADLRSAAEKKRVEMQKEIDERTAFAAQLGKNAASGSFIAQGVKEGTSFAGSIGAGAMQQTIVFELHGDVVGDDGWSKLKAAVTASLNREATLRGVAGK